VSRLVRRRPGPEIGLTPMIDVLFLVLMFLLLTTTFREATFLRVTLPEAVSGSRDAASHLPVRIVIDEHGAMAVGERPITLDDLVRMLAAIRDTDAADVRIAADERVDHGRVVAVMDAVRHAGIHRVMIETWSSTAVAQP
jgi:biopolymer transport protein ExbD